MYNPDWSNLNDTSNSDTRPPAVTLPWQLEVLGRLRATRGERRIERFPTRKTGALLACLALDPGRPATRDALIETFWPDSAPDAGRNSLSQALTGLRRLLEGDGAAGPVLVADRFTVAVAPGAVETDAARLRDAWRAARRLDPASAAYRDTLQAAAALYHGELLPGVDGDWATVEREALARIHLEILGALVQRLVHDGDAARAVEVARAAVAADPLREPAHRDLMRALAAAGRRVEALRHHRDLERLLDAELGVQPDAETLRLVDDIRATATPRAPAGARPGVKPGTASTPMPLPAGPATVLALRLTRVDVPADAVAAYVRALGRTLRALGGSVIRPGIDETLVAFAEAADAVAAALDAVRRAEATPGLGAHAGLHSGDLDAPPGTDAEPVGPVAQRIAAIARAGQVLVTEETAIRAGPSLEADDRAVDVGRYPVRPDAAPERLFRIQHGRDPAGAPAPAAVPPAQTTRLPVRLSRFVGREDERRHLLAQLARPEVRLVTITGIGGTGKTRLAIETAGAWEALAAAAASAAATWVDLGAIDDGRQVGRAVAAALDLPVPEADDPLPALRAALARGPALVVLDNFEQLVPSGAPVVGRLLAACPELKCIVTSRVRLGLEGEHELQLPPLPVPGTSAGVADLEHVPSVQLFVDRVRAADPGFRLDAANAADVARLCAALEGIPLAIELAAARATVLSPRQMLERLGTRLAWLAAKRADLGERQRSLRGAIDWSYDLLDTQTRADFAAVSVFRGTWDIEAAEAVLDDVLAVERMAELRDASLVVTRLDAGGVRYGMLETVRLYAAEKLDEAREGDLRARHARHFAVLAEAAEPGLNGPDQRAWIDRLAREHDNLMAALAWCAGTPGDPATGLRLACGLPYYWYTRGHLRAGLALTARLLERPEAAADSALHARALLAAGGMAAFLDDTAAAERYLADALALQRAASDTRGATLSLYQLAVLTFKRGDVRAAHAQALESADRFRQMEGLAARRGLAAALNLLGMLDFTAGDLQAAGARWHESLALVREVGDTQGVANVLDNLVALEIATGQLAEAAAHVRETVALADALGSRWVALKALSHRATIEARRGDAVQAARVLGAVSALSADVEPAMAPEVAAAIARQAPDLRQRLGDAAFEAAWREGQGWDWARVVAWVGDVKREADRAADSR